MVTWPGPGAGSSRSANRTTSGPPGSMISIALTASPLQSPRGADAQAGGDLADGGAGLGGLREQRAPRSGEQTSPLQSHLNLVCPLLLAKKKPPPPHSPDR